LAIKSPRDKAYKKAEELPTVDCLFFPEVHDSLKIHRSSGKYHIDPISSNPFRKFSQSLYSFFKWLIMGSMAALLPCFCLSAFIIPRVGLGYKFIVVREKSKGALSTSPLYFFLGQQWLKNGFYCFTNHKPLNTLSAGGIHAGYKHSNNLHQGV
jgi:hypothetical protein